MVIEGYRKILTERPKNAKIVRSIFDIVDIVPYGKYYSYDRDKPIYLNVGTKYYEYPMSIIDSDEFCINDYINKSLILI